MIGALRERDYAIYAYANFAANIGLWVQRIAAQWLGWQLTHSYVWLGALALSEALAIVVVTPVAGALTDRLDRLKLARASQLATIAMLAALALATWSGTVTPALLAAAVFALGLADGFWAPARLAIVANLASRENLPSALGISSFFFNLSWALGPIVGGAIIATAGTAGAFLTSALCVAVLVAGLSAVRLRSAQNLAPRMGIFREIAEGCAFIARSPLLAPLLVISAAASLLLRSYRDLLAGIADEVFARGEQGLATLATASGVGALMAATYLALRRQSSAPRDIALAIALGAAGLMGLALAGRFEFAIVAAGALGMSITLAAISCQIMVQQAVPDIMRGRVLSFWGLQVRALPPVGSWLLGAGAGLAGVQAALFSAGVLALGLAVAAYLLTPRLERLAVDILGQPQTP
jgi:MFS family permease